MRVLPVPVTSTVPPELFVTVTASTTKPVEGDAVIVIVSPAFAVVFESVKSPFSGVAPLVTVYVPAS